MRRLALTSIALSLPLAFAACTPQARYPAIEGDVATESLNTLPSPIVMRLALQRVADRHLRTADGAYDILLPVGVNDSVASDIARELGDEVYVTSTLDQEVPVLAIRRVIVLGDTATVDVERPVPNVDARQLITVRLRSSIRGWRVEGLRSWPVGLEVAPVEQPPMTAPEPQGSGTENQPAEMSDPDLSDDVPELQMDTEPLEDDPA